MDGGVNILYTNAQSINNKLSELGVIVGMKRPDIVALTETWTNEKIDNELLILDGYQMVERRDRKDTAGGRGGGILVYVKNELNAWREEVDTNFNQCATIKIKRKRREMSLHIVYRSPNSTMANDDVLCSWMKQLKGDFILIGDFNFPGIDWARETSNERGRMFLETCQDKFIEQHVEEPTHGKGNILDLVLSSDSELINKVEMDGKLGSSDHEMIWITVVAEIEREKRENTYRNYKNADYEKIRKDLHIDWDQRLANKDTDETWLEIKGVIQDVMNKHVPMKTIRNANGPRWMNGEIRRMIKEKKRAWDKWKKSKSEEDKKAYKNIEKKTKKTIKNKKNELERTVAREAKTNPSNFYSYVNRAKRTRGKIGPLKDADGCIVVDAQKQADMLNTYYASVFTKSLIQTPTKDKTCEHELNDIDITEEKIMKVIDGLKENSAPGPDGITNKILKEAKNELAHPLEILFRRSLDEGKIPEDWREANITAIFKKGERADPGNYRPVNLTSGPCKTMEIVVKGEIDKHSEENGCIENSQHGFRRGRSPQTNLIEFMNVTTKWIDEGRSFDIVYFDFQKAFDKVCH